MEIDIEIDLLDSINGILLILKQLKPKWNSEMIQLKEMKGGLMNKLICCHLPDSLDEKVLIKIYGRNTQFVIDHANGKNILEYLSNIGMIRPLLGSFCNGLVYTYTEGSCVTRQECVSPPIRTKIAAFLAKFHRLHPPKLKCEPTLWKTIESCIQQIPGRYPDEKVQERYENLIPPKGRLLSEIEWVHNKCDALASPLVFCHNDLSQSNILFDSTTEKISFIDFELCQYNYQAMDFAHLFCFKVYDDLKVNFKYEYATDDELRAFFTEYLIFLDDGDCSSTKVEMLIKHTRYFQLADHLFQCVWALQQVVHSCIDYDYMQFARNQLDIYYKAKILALTN